MTRNMEYYKLWPENRLGYCAVHSVYELNSDSMDKFVTRKPRHQNVILVVQCNHQKRLAQHRVRLAQVNQEKDTDHVNLIVQ